MGLTGGHYQKITLDQQAKPRCFSKGKRDLNEPIAIHPAVEKSYSPGRRLRAIGRPNQPFLLKMA
jgi:hypothetical protein